MATYSGLQSTIASELSRDDLTTPIQSAILSAIRHYQRKLMLFNQTTQAISTVAGTSEYSLSSDFLAFERISLVENGDVRTLVERSYDEIATIDVSAHDGVPTKFAYRNFMLRLYPVPDAVYAVTVYYWSLLDPPSDGADSTVWTNDAVDLIRHRAKADLASNTIRDDRAAQIYRMHEDDTLGGMIVQRDRLLSNGIIQPTQF